jgi:hypothetical protein
MISQLDFLFWHKRLCRDIEPLFQRFRDDQATSRWHDEPPTEIELYHTSKAFRWVIKLNPVD